MKREPDKYLPEAQVFEFPGWKITVHRPDITPEERARRMKLLHDAAASLLMEKERVYRNVRESNAGLSHNA